MTKLTVQNVKQLSFYYLQVVHEQINVVVWPTMVNWEVPFVSCYLILKNTFNCRERMAHEEPPAVPTLKNVITRGLQRLLKDVNAKKWIVRLSHVIRHYKFAGFVEFSNTLAWIIVVFARLAINPSELGQYMLHSFLIFHFILWVEVTCQNFYTSMNTTVSTSAAFTS